MSNRNSQQKKQRLKFDHLPGDTAWARLMTWIRRRRLRTFMIYTGIFLLMFSLIGYAVYVDVTDEGVSLGDDFPIILSLLAFYSIPCIWMLVWIFVPEKHRQIRKIKRLGDRFQLAQELEEDLISPDGILYQKRGVLVTPRFIVDVSYGTFSLYPLDGLVKYDITAVPVFHYEDGKQIEVTTAVSFKHLIPYIHTENRSIVSVNHRSKFTRIISFILMIGILSILSLVTIFSDHLEAVLDDVSFFSKGIAFLFFGAVGFVVLFIALKVVRNLRKMRRWNKMNVDEKIQHMEEMNSNTPKYDVNQLNTLSTLYYEKEDLEKALSLVREALHMAKEKETPASDTKTIRLGSQTALTNILRLNETHYLAELGRPDEAEQVLDALDDKKMSGRFLYLYNTHRARIALCRQETFAVREFLQQARTLKASYSKRLHMNLNCHLLLIDAQCDLLENDPTAAVSKLDQIIAECTYSPTVHKAEKIKDRIR